MIQAGPRHRACGNALVILLAVLSPPALGGNLIENGAFEKGEVGKLPAGWQHAAWIGGQRYNVGTFSVELDGKVRPGCGQKCLRITGTDITFKDGKQMCRAGVWSRPFALEEDTKYRITFVYKTSARKYPKGYTPAYLSIGGNVGPEWRERWLGDTGGVWRKVAGVFHHVGPKQQARMLIRSNADGDVWFDEIVVAPAGRARVMEVGGRKYPVKEHEEDHPALSPSDEDKARGYVIFRRGDPAGIYPTSFPAPGEEVRHLRTFATPGEYEPISFALYPLKDLTHVTVELTDLVSKEGKVLSKECVEVRTVRCWVQAIGRGYHVVPELLEKAVPLDLKTKVPQQYWLTFHVPKDASAGKYKGTIRIRQAGGRGTQLELGLRVLPFALVEKLPYHVGYYADISAMNPANPTTRFTWEEVELRLRDMKEHGMNCMVYSFPESTWDIRLMGDRRSKRVKLDFSVDNRVVGVYRKLGFSGPVILDLTRLSSRLAGFLKLTYPRARYRGGSRGDTLFLSEEEAPAEYVRGFKEAARQIYRNAIENGWRGVIFYPVDEPAYQGEATIKAAILQYKWIKEAVPQATTLCPAKPKGFSMANKERLFRQFSPYLDIRTGWIWGPEENELNRRMVKEGVYKEMWGVNGPANTETQAYSRARESSGFKLKKSGMTGITYWTYGYMGQRDGKGGHLGIRDGDWDPHVDIPRKRIAVSYRSPKDLSRVPTLAWEGVREGLDDLKQVLAGKFFSE